MPSCGLSPKHKEYSFLPRSPYLRDISRMFLMVYSLLDMALLLVLLQPSGDGYFWLCCSKSSFRGTVTKLKHSFESYLFSTSCEEGKCVLYSENRSTKDAPKRAVVLSRLHYILQATSLQRTVYTKNKAGHNSTRGSKLFVVFPAETTAAHSLHFQHLYVDCGYRFKTPIVKEAFS